MVEQYRDRAEAGRRLADRLHEYAGRDDVLVLGLPSGGVPVAFEIACTLDAPLDVFVVRKLGVPGHAELAMGAIASGRVCVINQAVVEDLRVPLQVIESVATREFRELEEAEQLYRGNRPAPRVAGQIVILVDDGLTASATMKAAVTSLRRHRPARIIVAVPTAPPSICEAVRDESDACVGEMTPEPIASVGMWYQNLVQVSDEEVRAILDRAYRAGTPWRSLIPTFIPISKRGASGNPEAYRNQSTDGT